MVDIIRQQLLMGQPVKLENLAIFKASVENKGGWTDLKDVSLRIGGDRDNIQAIRLVAQATGDFTKAELSKDGKLVLDRQSAALVRAAGGNPDGSGDSSTSSPQDSDSSSDSSSSSSTGSPQGGGGTGSITPTGGDGGNGGNGGGGSNGDMN